MSNYKNTLWGIQNNLYSLKSFYRSIKLDLIITKRKKKGQLSHVNLPKFLWKIDKFKIIIIIIWRVYLPSKVKNLDIQTFWINYLHKFMILKPRKDKFPLKSITKLNKENKKHANKDILVVK